MVIFLPLLAQKFQQVKTCFQHLQPKFFPVSPHIYLLALCYPSMFIMLFVLSIPLNEMMMLFVVMEKVG